MNVKNLKNLLLPSLALAVVSAGAVAGTAGTEFDTMYGMVKDWTEGTLGKLLAVSAFLIGMGMGIVRQSILAIVLGIGFALALAYTPNIIDAIFTFAV
jgi:conjugal transfer pilus assembly protein TraA